MKRTNILFWIQAALLLCSLAAKAQKFDPKRIKLMDPPDLQVTGMGLLKADNTTDWLFTIQVTIRNNSFIRAPASRVRIMVQNPDSPGTTWQAIDYDDFPEVQPRDAVLREITIHDKRGMMRKIKSFNLKVIADCDSKVQESNERNNESVSIRISKR